jgi:polar amino acid transport system substrate-binding protein
MQAVYRQLAPNGVMRAGINLGNVSIVRRDDGSGQLRGIAVDLVDDLARRLALDRALLTYEGAGPLCDAGLAGDWDIAFMAIDPERAKRLDFTAPYLVLEGSFLVPADSPMHTVLDLDGDGVDIAVAQASFHDLHLTRTLRHARLVKSATFAGAVSNFLARNAHAVGGLRPALDAVASSHHGLRVIEGRYAAVQQAIALPKGRAAAMKYLNSFLKTYGPLGS